MNETVNQANEIEIKANVCDKAALLDFLYKHAKYKKKYYKKDFYYGKLKNGAFDRDGWVRMRLEHGGYTFTSKSRVLDEAVEFNIERNMLCTKKQSKLIIKFIEQILEMKLYVVKEKKGRAFIYKNTLVEVSTVKGLGDFIEIEILENKLSGIPDKVSFLKQILSELSIDESSIETRLYIDLLSSK